MPTQNDINAMLLDYQSYEIAVASLAQWLVRRSGRTLEHVNGVFKASDAESKTNWESTSAVGLCEAIGAKSLLGMRGNLEATVETLR